LEIENSHKRENEYIETAPFVTSTGHSPTPHPPRPLPETSAKPAAVFPQKQLSLLILTVIALGLVLVRWADGFIRTRPSEIVAQNPQQKINLNQADKNTLMTLPGIGPSTADAIISHRQQHGPFPTVESLTSVAGIKQATLGKLAPYLVVDSVYSPSLPSSQNAQEPEILLRKPSKSSPSFKAIPINTATQAEIETLPGIGPVLAKSIIAEREKKRFDRVEDLRRVSGIGPKRLEQIRDFIWID
jgi:competence ComEA-like helix-hairpin-helix protein